MTAKEYNEQHAQLIERWIKEYGAGDGVIPFAADGILDPENWFSLDNQEERILFILKEAYDTGGDLPSYVDCSSLHAGQPYPRVWSLSNFLYGRECTELCSKKSLDSCLKCRNFKGTYGNCVAWIYAMEQDTTVPSYKHFQAYCDENEGARVNLLRKTAVINIKKPNGKRTSDFCDLMDYTKRDAEKLREQIEVINPTLILCGGTFNFFKCLYPDVPQLIPCKNHPKKKHYGCAVYNQRKIISMPHPAYLRSRSMYEDVVANYNEILRLCKND